jgi:hypothetical protein
MEKFYVFVRKHGFFIALVGITLLAIFLRFYDYPDRWILAYDQAHGAIVSRYALLNGKLPLLGPFSSAGPFQTGGEWYWFIIAGTALFPFTITTPWVFLTVTYVLFVVAIIFVGRELVNQKFGLIAGLLAAVSTAQIQQGLNLTNQSPLSLIALGCIWMAARYVKSKQSNYLFFLGVLVGLGASIHLQGIALATIVFPTLLLGRLPKIRGLLYLVLGVVIPWIPVFIADTQNNFFTFRNMMQYYMSDQYKIPLEMLGRRWITYTAVFWPNSWAYIIGGVNALGYVAILTTFVALFMTSLRTQKIFWILAGSLFLSFIMLRYTRTPLFESYLVFLHPSILLLTAWAVYKLYQRQAILGFLLLLLFVGGSLVKDSQEIVKAENTTANHTQDRFQALRDKYPGEKFAVYGYGSKLSELNMPLSLYLDVAGLSDNDGKRVGVVYAPSINHVAEPIIHGTNKDIYFLVELEASSAAKLKELGWTPYYPAYVYTNTQEWYKNPDNPLLK